MLRFALFGAGRIGRMHAETLSLHPATELIYVYDIHRPTAEQVATQYGARTASNVDEILSDKGIDAVLIASSTHTHVSLLEQAAAAGKAVLCEKPIDLDFTRVEQCRAALSELQTPIQIGFNRRFDPGHQALYRAIQDGEIGNLEQLIITSRDPGLPSIDYLKHSGGLFRDMLIHDFDMARFILGEDPVEVCAYGSALVDVEVSAVGDIDSAMVILKTATGRLCHINGSRRATYGYDQRIEALGSKGMLLSNNPTKTHLERYRADSTAAREPLKNFFIDRYEEAYRLQVAAFVSAVEKGQAPTPSFEDGYKAQLLAEAAIKSLQSGSSVRLDG
ncbi:inositol 2-dehydrogenase [Pseudomonas luteola]|uniref:inositol 2-dehydrogenase n=1 Tax=Pseudomonas luteola TaxID=47886 RepID=UPI000F79AE9A|nr:inositol 2-dehydrogenase [Pseudomonas luteola]RRW40393.1 inositol 2-dehydrogenase [Pseudomonas luteola]